MKPQSVGKRLGNKFIEILKNLNSVLDDLRASEQELEEKGTTNSTCLYLILAHNKRKFNYKVIKDIQPCI